MDLIDRKALLDRAKPHGMSEDTWTNCTWYKLITGMPRVNVEQNYAQWIDRGGIFECSNCSAESGVMTRHCSDCGYQMDGGAT